MKVLYVARAINNMAGGVERMITTIMNALHQRGHTIHLFTWDLAEAQSFYRIEDEIVWYRLDMGDPMGRAGIGLKVRRAVAIRKLVRRENYDAIVCFQDGPYMAMKIYTLLMGVPVIAAERNAPTRFEHTSAKKRQHIIYGLLRFARKILVQCASYKEMYPVYLRSKIDVIANPVQQVSRFSNVMEPVSETFILLSVGRLSYQKNYPALIDAFAKIASDFPNWCLRIVGEGEDREKLEQQIKKSGVADQIELCGNSQDVSTFLCEAHLFCLPSLWEGFPNALAEAMAHGLPVVGFKDCAGVNDLINDQKNGLLADKDSLASCLSDLMSNDCRRHEMGENAIISMKAFKPEAIFTKWETVLSECRKSWSPKLGQGVKVEPL